MKYYRIHAKNPDGSIGITPWYTINVIGDIQKDVLAAGAEILVKEESGMYGTWNKGTVVQFLHNYCTRARKNENIWKTELMMDNHSCRLVGGKLWYVPEHSYLMDGKDKKLCDYLLSNSSFDNVG